jgi:hypothetical protein
MLWQVLLGQASRRLKQPKAHGVLQAPNIMQAMETTHQETVAVICNCSTAA